ncbi:MAG: hypothetical protein ACTSY1_00400 [Alphaproteobacteria bacterium]
MADLTTFLKIYRPPWRQPILFALTLAASPVLAQEGQNPLVEEAAAAQAAGNLETAAALYERAAAQCAAPAQLALVEIYRKGKGRKPDGELAFAWAVSAQRATDNWSAQAVADFARLTQELPAYMSDAQRHGAYCRGLELLAQSCGAGGILRRIERWLACS